MRWVIDASVAAKWLVTESGSDAAHALIDDELLAPDTLFGECANVLWKKVVRNELDAAIAEGAMWALRSASLDRHASEPLMASALELAIQLRHPVYDCIYLALSLHQVAPLITADRRLYQRCRQPDAQALGLRVELLGSAADDPAVH